VIEMLNELAEAHPTRGFDWYYGNLRNKGLIWNRKRVLRIYRTMNLKLRRKRKRRILLRPKQPLVAAKALNETWSMDFLSDALSNGRRVRILIVMDDANREALAAYADYSICAEKVIQVLQQLEEEKGLPLSIRTDNGPEFISKKLAKWCEKKQIEQKFIQPGKPMQNGYNERLNRTYREDVLDAYFFDSLEQLRILSDQWLETYNSKHPHRSMKGLTPNQKRIWLEEEAMKEKKLTVETIL
jgi:putative transposase